MKTVDQYLRQPGAITATAFSAKIGVTKGWLSRLRSSTEWPPELALKVEEETGGQVSACDISPLIAKARSSAPGEPLA